VHGISARIARDSDHSPERQEFFYSMYGQLNSMQPATLEMTIDMEFLRQYWKRLNDTIVMV
jgi:hypothetical protein